MQIAVLGFTIGTDIGYKVNQTSLTKRYVKTVVGVKECLKRVFNNVRRNDL